MKVSCSSKKNGRVGDPLSVAKQFYQVNARLGKPNSPQGQGHLNHRITIWKEEDVRVADMDELLGRCETNIDIEGDLPQTLEQSGKDDELLLHMRVTGSLNAVEQPHQVRLATGKAELTVTQIESLSDGYDDC
jgi:hypothetical protein